MDDQKLKELANKLLFDPNQQVIDLAHKLLDSINVELKQLEEFDLEGVKPMSFINEKAIDFTQLRLDEINEDFYFKRDQILNNAKEHNDEFVIMKRVVNEN